MTVTLIPAHTTLAKATQTILNTDKYNELWDAIHQLHDVFAELTEIRAENIDDNNILLASGKAISTVQAAHCLLEIERTRKFVCGVYKALIQLIEENPFRKINVLYAGCGPYATLLTPLTSIFQPEQVSFTLLDINPVSLKAARTLYTQLDLLAYVSSFQLADATLYQVEGKPMDLIISETMLNALQKEPQLTIMENLIPQLNPKGLFIPQEIQINAALSDWQEENKALINTGTEPQRIMLGNVYNASRQFVMPQPLTLPLPAPQGFRNLNLLTDIQVFGDEKLTTYNCSLTMPYMLTQLEDENWPVSVSLTYTVSENPGFEYSLQY